MAMAETSLSKSAWRLTPPALKANSLRRGRSSYLSRSAIQGSFKEVTPCKYKSKQMLGLTVFPSEKHGVLTSIAHIFTSITVGEK